MKMKNNNDLNVNGFKGGDFAPLWAQAGGRCLYDESKAMG